MSDDKRIKADVSIEKVLFFKDNWGIISCSVDREIEGKVQLGRFNNACFKGQMPELKEGQMCTVIADLVHDNKYGDQYNIVSIWDRIDFAETDDRGKKKYLASLFTEKQVNMMYEALDDPFMALKNHDMESLVKIKGCGLKTANLWVRRFDMSYKRAKIYIELEGYDLTNNMIDRLLKTYGSPDLVIDKVKNNPYILVNEVEGVGWSKADDIAIAGGVDPLGVLRIKEYIKYYLNQCGHNGMSWVTTDQLLGAILDNVSEDVADEDITAAIRELGDKLWYSDDKQRIGLRKYHILAENIAKELLRIRDAESKFKYDGWEQRVKNLEDEQGWKFTDEQKSGIEAGLKNNIILIQGYGGTGKSSLVNGILTSLPNYSHVMCALSGRASARLAEVTGEEGYTIHRLLGYPKGDVEHQNFEYNQDNKLGYDIYILDEISMVDAKLFYYLIRAIPSGAKLLMLGDPGQLESIGCGNIAYDIIHSKEIIDVLLTNIHRQAAKSAIITDSLAIRNGLQLVDKDWSGTRTDGELKDLVIDCYLDKTNSYYKVMEYFQRIRSEKDFNIMETQILVPVKKRGSANTYTLNNDIQELYNPASKNKKEESVMTISSGLRIFRVGDKVINTQNNYKVDPPIFNGNIGMIKDITIKQDEDTGEDVDIMIIDFMGIGRVEIPKEYWKQLDLGYVITAHKGQGSEFNNVIFCFDFDSYALLTRQLVYTGITRAKKKCYLTCQTSALRYATMQEAVSQKQTHLQECLYEIAHPKLVF